MDEFFFNDENEKNIKQCLKDFTIQSDKIITKAYIAYKLERDADKIIEIDEDKEQVKILANIDIYVTKETKEKSYKVPLVTNTMLKLNFNSFITSPKEYIFFLDADEELISENKFVKDVGNASNVFYYIINGRLEKLAKKGSYNSLLPVFMDIMDENEVSNHKSIGYEILITELCRDKKDINTPFRLVVQDNNMKGGFQSINIREIPRSQSPVSALFGENIMQSIVTTTNTTMSGKKPKLTPMEEITLNKFE